MSPIYEFRCVECERLTQELRPMYARRRPGVCQECGHETRFVLSVPAKRTDGIYSYAENIGERDIAGGEPPRNLDGDYGEVV